MSRMATGGKVVISVAVIVIVITLIVFLFADSRIFNEKWHCVNNVLMANGDVVLIEEWHSDSRYIDLLGHGQGFSMGRDADDVYQWQADGAEVVFRTKFTPIIYGNESGAQYIVVFDRESDPGKSIFRLYRMNGKSEWEEISPGEFPKKIAIQNSWIDQSGQDIINKMDPKNYWFRNSLTGKLWLYLSCGLQYYESKKRDNDVDFFEKFIQENGMKNIRPRREVK